MTVPVSRPPVTLDLDTSLQCSLDRSLFHLLRQAADPAMLATGYRNQTDIDTSSLPFGRMKREVVLQAKELLEELEPLVKQRDELDEQKYQVEGDKQEEVLMELGKVLSSISRLSTEYYYLVPKNGYQYEKVTPIDSEDDITKERHRLNVMLEFETSKSLLLGAMLRK